MDTSIIGRIDPAPLMLTLKVAAVATACAFVAGAASSRLMSRARFPGSGWLDALFAMPLVLPPTVVGYYLIVVVGRNGFLGRWLMDVFGMSLVFTWQGAAVAASVASFPLVYKSARAAFEGVDTAYEDAARTLGQTEASVFFRVSFPLAWRGVMAGTMLAFARAMGEFGATLMVAGNLPGRTQTLSLAIYDAVASGDDALGMALVAVTTVICMVVLVGSGRILNGAYNTGA
jgi:molybdate transport system permease protein